MSLPLSGIRVVEIASFVAVPAAGTLLADLGAEVIKVEVPWGEIFRHARPRLAGYQSDFPAGPPFQMDNRGKRSLAIDLALREAREALMKVIARADVVLTNVLPERLARYHLSPDELRATRPELIVGRISGYGADGPRADDPAFDYTAFWALSGLMDSMRDPQSPPAWMRPGVGDHSAALALVTGVLAALRTRDRTGEGQVVEVTLQQIGYYINGNDTAYALATGERPPRHDRQAPRNPLWNHYPCRGEGWLFLVMIDSDRYWPALCRALERDDLATDPRFVDAQARFRNAKALVGILDAIFAARPVEGWSEALSRERLIWAPMQTLDAAIQDPNAEAIGCFSTVEHPQYGRFRSVAPPIRLSAHPMPGTATAPLLSADTAAVLREAGVDEETVALLVAVAS
jgi:crotonobetainyl-CoA:carnitine CoA-transferase CaiB-like acyl-CoA transferase